MEETQSCANWRPPAGFVVTVTTISGSISTH